MTRQRILAAILFLKRIARDKKGGLLVLTAILMPVIAGFAGLGIDATLWVTQKRYIQSMSDAGAMAGAYLALNNSSSTQVLAAAQKEATRNGLNLGNGVGQDAIAINSPPTSGAYAGKAGFVEMRVTRNAPLYFSSLLNINSVKVASRAVAGGVKVGAACVLALDNTMDRAVEFSGTANVKAGCGVASNSSSSQSIYIGGNATLTADPAQAYGDIYVGGSGTLITNSPVEPFAQRLADPYAYLPSPSAAMPSACTMTNASIGNNVTLSPGRYCGGLNIKGSGVTLSPGTYYVDAGDLTSNAGANFSGTGVTFVLTATNPSQIGHVKMNGNTTANLISPHNGSVYDGILFYQDPAASSTISGNTGVNSFLGGANLNLSGVLYFPQQEVDFTGGASASPACLQIVARKVTFLGSSNIQNDPTACDTADVDPISRIQVRLVE